MMDENSSSITRPVSEAAAENEAAAETLRRRRIKTSGWRLLKPKKEFALLGYVFDLTRLVAALLSRKQHIIAGEFAIDVISMGMGNPMHGPGPHGRNCSVHICVYQRSANDEISAERECGRRPWCV